MKNPAWVTFPDILHDWCHAVQCRALHCIVTEYISEKFSAVPHIAIRSDMIGRAVHTSTLGLKISNKNVIINMQ